MRKHTWIALLASLMMVPLAVACDDGDDEMDAGMEEEDAGGDMDDAGEDMDDAGEEETNTIADIAAGDPQFSMLVAAADRAELIPLLSGTDEFTVFAPTNDAFEDSGITMAMIESMPTAQLRGILTYHALEGVVMSGDIEAGPATTAAMLSIILGTEGGVTINGGNSVTGGANVTMADIEADNGVIHVIDRVLLPPTVADLTRYAGLTELAAAVASDTDIADALSDPEAELTVFAPTNDAFPDDTTGLDVPQILLYHVLGERVPSTAIPAMADTLATMSYEDGGTTREYALDVFFDTSDGVAVNGGSGTEATNLGGDVVIADVLATNGIVHVIDGVLLPLNIAEVAQVAGFDTLVSAVVASDPIPASIAGSETAVLDALSEDTLAPLTVFAPTNDAFDTAFPSGLPSDGGAILGVLALHVIASPLPVRAEDLPGDTSTTVAPLAGSDLSFDTSATPPTVSVTGGGSTAGITGTDVGANNGIVHVIDTVLTEAP
ncbi:MAG TPA: fasciclin domain-containing protein [Sandaracinaceae bacterium LLY-WYZ-13_1]|nr:fasciclin domain-containing protein [Sandaracinaceae bacterium LLY-WYZ-13_1]